MATSPIDPVKLVELRGKRDLSQRALAELASCSKATIEKAERGEALRDSLIARIAAALGVAPSALIDRPPEGSDPRVQFASYLEQLRSDFEAMRFLDIRLVDSGAQQSIPTIDELFVEPYLLTSPRNPEATPADWTSKEGLGDDCQNRRASAVLGKPGHYMIDGPPGSGKSTLMAWFILQLAQSHSTALSAQLGERLPIPIVLREIDLFPEMTWRDLLRQFHQWCGRKQYESEKTIELNDLIAWVTTGRAVLIFEGVDELSLESRRILRSLVWQLINEFPDNVIIGTTRLVGYEECPFDQRDLPVSLAAAAKGSKAGKHRASPDLEDAPAPQRQTMMTRLSLGLFDDRQIRDFCQHWYRRALSDHMARIEAEKLWKAIHDSPSTLTLARIPNVLTIMSGLFENDHVLPHGKAKLYSRIADLYLDGLDRAKGIQAEQKLRFPLEDRKLWLGRVAWEIQLRRAAHDPDDDDDEVLLISAQQFLGWVADESRDPNDPEAAPTSGELKLFLRLVQTRAGLIVERGPDRYSFVHLSFVEYFAAHYLLHSFEDPVGRPFQAVSGTPRKNKRGPNPLSLFAGQPLWHEVILFAIEAARATLPKKRSLLLKQLIPWFDPQTATAPAARSEEQITIRSNEWIILTRLSEDRHAGLETSQQRIRQACQVWADRVDPLDDARWIRDDRFRDRWLSETSPDFADAMWDQTLSPLVMERRETRGERREPAGHSDGSLRSPGDFGEIADNGPPLTAIGLSGLSGYGLSPTAARALVRIIAQRLTDCPAVWIVR